MAALPVRNALTALNNALGDPSKVLYSAGSILAAYNCDPAGMDQALARVSAVVNQALDVPVNGSRNVIRVGAIDSVHFHAEIKPGAELVNIRLFSPPTGEHSPADWTTAHDVADAAFQASGDSRQALMSYISTKLMGDPEDARRLASDLSRLVADYMRMQVMGTERGAKANGHG